jgi:predicted nuclease of predicted toxin-antitoxin system
MRILLDACVWGGALQEFEAAGHDVLWAGAWADDPGDEEILSLAWQEGRTLVTLDKDFGELAIVRGKPHAGIVRLVNFAARSQAAVCMHVLSLHAEELRSGAIVTVEPGKVRIRPARTEPSGN